MSDSLLLVDYENIQAIDFSRLGEEFEVIIFVGCTQKMVAVDLIRRAQPLGDRVHWVQVEGMGANALDFYIAYYLGAHFAQHPTARCLILSKDSGFDPLIRHLKLQGRFCKRIVCTGEPSSDHKPAEIRPEDANYQRVLATLMKSKKAPKSFPGTRATLTKYIAHIFQNKLSESEVKAILCRLFKEGKVVDEGEKIRYQL